MEQEESRAGFGMGVTDVGGLAGVAGGGLTGGGCQLDWVVTRVYVCDAGAVWLLVVVRSAMLAWCQKWGQASAWAASVRLQWTTAVHVGLCDLS